MENLSSDQISRIKELLNTLDLNSFNQSLIKDNKIIFVLDTKVYRCVMPSQKDLALAEDLENRLKVQFLQKENYVTRKKLKQILKEKQGIDIDELESQKEIYQNQLKDIYLDIASTETDQEDKLKILKEKKHMIEEKFTSLIIEITEYLKPSIEDQIRKKYYEFLTYLCTEKSIEKNEWLKVWDTIDDYENDNSKLSHNAVGYLQTLMLNIRD